MLNKNNLHVGSLLTTNIMSGGQNTDFKAMSVAAIKKYLQERGVSVNGYLKPGLVEIAVAVEKMWSGRQREFYLLSRGTNSIVDNTVV